MRLPQWRVKGMAVVLGDQAPAVAAAIDTPSAFSVVIDIRRRSFFTVRLVIIPLTLIVILSWSVFWMDRSTLGDRVNISFVGILTAVAYQILIGDILPHISYFTWMNGFVNLSLFLMCATVIVNLVVGACDKRGQQGLGDLIDFRCRWIFPFIYVGIMLLFSFIAFSTASRSR